jgi:hypothetical protein
VVSYFFAVLFVGKPDDDDFAAIAMHALLGLMMLGLFVTLFLSLVLLVREVLVDLM